MRLIGLVGCMSIEPIADAEVVEEGQPPGTVPVEASTQLVRRERRSEILKPLDVNALVESFEDYQRLLQRILIDDDWQGRPNVQGSFVKKKGWRKIATAFDLDVTLIPGTSKVERDADGRPLRAEAWARAVSPSGRMMDGDGYCSIDEPRFGDAGGRQKIENDLRATATTRAKNKAISDLVGMGAVSAEEVDSAPETTTGPPFGPETSNERLFQARAAIGYLLKIDHADEKVTLVLREIAKEANGYLPEIASAAVYRTARMVKEGTAQSLEEQPHAS